MHKDKTPAVETSGIDLLTHPNVIQTTIEWQAKNRFNHNSTLSSRPFKSFNKDTRHIGKTFEDCFYKNGYPRCHPICDGKIYRFGKKQKYWYVYHHNYGLIGDWSNNLPKVIWQNDKDESINSQIPETLIAQIHREEQLRQDNRINQQKKVAQDVQTHLKTLSYKGESAYLKKKKISGHNVYYGTDNHSNPCIFIPLVDINFTVWSYQQIYDNGKKYFRKGGKKQGCFHLIGNIYTNDRIVFTEGYATGASIYEATGYTTVICFDAGNIEHVIKVFKEKHPRHTFLIATDNDAYGKVNTGKNNAEIAAMQYGCKIALPVFKNIDTCPTDFNDLYVLEGKEKVQDQIITALNKKTLKCVNLNVLLSTKLKPRNMLMNPIIPEQGLVMIYAKRGVGKTLLGLTMGLAVASGKHILENKWTCSQPRKVLVLDGEMPTTSLQERLHAIIKGMFHSGEKPLIPNNLLFLLADLQDDTMPDLATQEGQHLIEEYLNGVEFLILDNLSSLCRHYRENEADSWVPIQEWLLYLRRKGIAVLLIHHANKNGQQRGTSRKEDLLDTVIELRPFQDNTSSGSTKFEAHYSKTRNFYGNDAKPFMVELLNDQDDGIRFIPSAIENALSDDIKTLSSEGLSQRQIAKQLGTSLTTVNRRLNE